MKYNSFGTSIIEAMVVMLVVVIGIVGMYGILSSSQKLSDMTHNRIEAIQIAREGIEAVMNIRDTNALLFQADLANCWNVLNYNTSCLSDTSTTYDIPHAADFVVYQDSITSRWILSEKTGYGADDYFNVSYKSAFQVKKSGDFYTQTGGTDFLPLFTRDIKIDYLQNDGTPASDSNQDKMKVQSIVRWTDTSSKKPYEIKLETVLTNWRKVN